MVSIAVYCASSRGADPGFAAAAETLGMEIARRGWQLVYGGGHVGLMGAVADAALGAGGAVHGVITRALADKEVAHEGLTRLEVVETMHERKKRMADLADAFVMLPGGFGTIEEFFEALTWTQLGVHAKPCGILDVDGFFDPLLTLLDGMVESGFLRAEHRDLVLAESTGADLLDALLAWEPVAVAKWLDRSER
jgi:uncharacterized protein (TIGR00730 family)